MAIVALITGSLFGLVAAAIAGLVYGLPALALLLLYAVTGLAVASTLMAVAAFNHPDTSALPAEV